MGRAQPARSPFDFENDEVDPENPIVISLKGPRIITAYLEAVKGAYISGSFGAVHSFPMALEEEYAKTVLRSGLDPVDESYLGYEYVEDEYIVMYNNFDFNRQSKVH